MVFEKKIKVIIEKKDEETIGLAEEYLLEVLEDVNSFDYFRKWIGGLIILNKYEAEKAKQLLIQKRTVVNEEKTKNALKQLEILVDYCKQDPNGIIYALATRN
jgi:hypothetical protein